MTGYNFDGLAERFKRKVYGGLKGKIRLAVLERDIRAYFPDVFSPVRSRPFSILDAGGGHGPLSLKLAEYGHRVTLCDISGNMLDLARKTVSEKKLAHQVSLLNTDIFTLHPGAHGPFDLILCHAVLDWTAEPEKMVRHLVRLLRPTGFLSLTFYNLDGMIFKNLIRANYKKVLKKDYGGYPGSLTPSFPRTVAQAEQWLEKEPVRQLCRSGIRVFHDYILDPEFSRLKPETVIDLELEFSQKLPFKDLGRYQHILVQRMIEP